MPQAELWAASARPIGFTFTYLEPDPARGRLGTIKAQPRWSKNPSGSNGVWETELDDFVVWYIPHLFQAGWTEYLGGSPANVGRATRASYRAVLRDFSEGLVS